MWMGRGGDPLVSVVVPAWNAELTLAETLRSISAQSYTNLEIIIVDDGSSDATAEVAAEFCSVDPRARLLRQDNGGVASARNAGIKEAKGEWIAPIDADDLWHATKIRKQVSAALSAAEAVGLVYCWYHYIDAQSRVIGSRAGWVTSGRALRQLAYENFVGNGSAPLMRREAILAAGGYDSTLRARQAQGCEDLLLQLLIARSWPVVAVPEYLVGYRVQPGTMSRDAAQMRRSWELIFDELRQRRVDVPERVARRAIGIQMFEFAEESALRGKWAEAIRLLGKGFRLDPLRCSLHLLYRSCRLLVRLARGRRTAPEPVPFRDADTMTGYQLDPDALRAPARVLRQFDAARLSKLRQFDQRDHIGRGSG